jgi:hypothetical protein
MTLRTYLVPHEYVDTSDKPEGSSHPPAHRNTGLGEEEWFLYDSNF